MQKPKISKELEKRVIDTIRTLSMDAVQEANSGHPGTPMAMAPVTFTLYNRLMKFNPKNPTWMNRDRFILSAGHASMLLYATLHVTGYEVSLDEIKSFRQLHSATPGHPEYGHTPGVETTTGPLGQGLATSVGFAIAQKWLAERYNKPGFNLIDYHIYSLAGDGCMMEGISYEAASLAGHLGLNNLVWIYDSNNITIEGSTSLAFSENVARRFEAQGWNVLAVDDANDTEKLHQTLTKARNATDAPTLVIVKSHIAFGAPNKQDTHGAHGAPLGDEEIRETKKFYGWDPDKKFFVPNDVSQHALDIANRGLKQNAEWDELFAAYQKEYPQLASELIMIQNNELPEGWDAGLPVFEAGTKMSGRVASSKVLNILAGNIPFMMGGSADLSPSTLTDIKTESSFERNNPGGRNMHFGIREHAMGAIANGMALSGLRTYASTFLVFSDYMRGSIRLSALMKLPVTYVFTHDSIGVGEDGPTHQPIEQVASLRAIPNLEVIRPADANEVAVLWKHIAAQKQNPVALILSRQDLPVIDRDVYASANEALKGAYVLMDSSQNPDIILMATGSEIQLALQAAEKLKDRNIQVRVVSMPSWELFDRQDEAYRRSVLPHHVKARIAIEAGAHMGWHKYVGLDGAVIGMQSFGASGKLPQLLSAFGFTADNITETAQSLLNIEKLKTNSNEPKH
ncbi:MAG: transketolase [Bacteroidales bacterium]|nr:transketolase [Bacteroidales bacterium]